MNQPEEQLTMDDLLREVVHKNGIAIDKSDPIMIIATLFQHIQDAGNANQAKSLRQFQEQIEAMLDRLDGAASKRTEQALNATVAASKNIAANLIEDSIKAASNETLELVRRNNEQSQALFSAAKRLFKIGIGLNLLAIAVVTGSLIAFAF